MTLIHVCACKLVNGACMLKCPALEADFRFSRLSPPLVSQVSPTLMTGISGVSHVSPTINQDREAFVFAFRVILSSAAMGAVMEKFGCQRNLFCKSPKPSQNTYFIFFGKNGPLPKTAPYNSRESAWALAHGSWRPFANPWAKFGLS